MHRYKGIAAATFSAFFLGLAPVFGRWAILQGFSPFLVVMLRTVLATLFLFLLLLLSNRRLFYIFSVGMLACFLAGLLNGLGSLLYYLALRHLSASLGQLIYSLYPFFVMVWMFFDGQSPSRLTLARMMLAFLSIAWLTYTPTQTPDWEGILLMLGAALLYALHLPINQRVLYEAPAPTVTFYTLLSMSLVVVIAYFALDRSSPPAGAAWIPLLGLTAVTFLSRLSLFLGVKHLGGVQAALFGLAEVLVTIAFGKFWLHEVLTIRQWIGILGLAVSLLTIRFEKLERPLHIPQGWLSWIRPPDIPPQVPWRPDR
jgi:drug/metabolite transporter (DMT)-like permease